MAQQESLDEGAGGCPPFAGPVIPLTRRQGTSLGRSMAGCIVNSARPTPSNALSIGFGCVAEWGGWASASSTDSMNWRCESLMSAAPCDALKPFHCGFFVFALTPHSVNLVGEVVRFDGQHRAR